MSIIEATNAKPKVDDESRTAPSTQKQKGRMLYLSLFFRLGPSTDIGYSYSDLKTQGSSIINRDITDTSFLKGMGLSVMMFPLNKNELLKNIGLDFTGAIGSGTNISLSTSECQSFGESIDCGPNNIVNGQFRYYLNTGFVYRLSWLEKDNSLLTLFISSGYHFAKAEMDKSGIIIFNDVNIPVINTVVNSWYARVAIGYDIPFGPGGSLLLFLATEYRYQSVELNPSKSNTVNHDIDIQLGIGMGFI